MAASRQMDVQIRKLRKKIRQIDNLEGLDRDLTDEEYDKISHKTSIRKTLLGLLSDVSYEQDYTDTTFTDVSHDTSHDLSSPVIADTYPDLSDTQENRNQNDDAMTDNLGNLHEIEQPCVGSINNSNNIVPEETENNPSMTSAQKRSHNEKEPSAMSTYTDECRQTAETLLRKEKMDEEKEAPAKKPRTQSNPAKKVAQANPNSQEKEKSQKLHQLRRKWCNQAFQVQCLQGHNDLVSAIDVCDDLMLSGSRDTMVKLWHLNTGTEERSFGGHTGTVTCVVLLDTDQSQSLGSKLGLEEEDGLRLGISGSADCSIKLWNLITGELIKSIYTYSPVSCLQYMASAHLVVSASDGGKIELWNLEAGSSIQSIRSHEDAVTSLQVHGNYVYSASTDGIIKVHELREQSLCTIFVSENIKTSSGAQLACRPIHCLLPINGKLFYGDDGVNIKILDWKTGIVDKISNHACEFGATDSLAGTADLLLSSGYDLDTGIGFINVRSLPGLEYICTVSDEELTRIRCMSATQLPHDQLRVIIGGIDLMVYKTTSRQDDEETISSSYAEQLTRPAQHSDIDSDSEFSDSDNEAGTFSHTGPCRRSKADSQLSSEGWFSRCTLL